VFALALGIGANATVFTIANAYLFQSLHLFDSEEFLYRHQQLDGRVAVSPIRIIATLRPGEVLRAMEFPDQTGRQRQKRLRPVQGAQLTFNAFPS